MAKQQSEYLTQKDKADIISHIDEVETRLTNRLLVVTVIQFIAIVGTTILVSVLTNKH